MKTTFEMHEVPVGATHFLPENDVYYAQWLKKEGNFYYHKCIRENGVDHDWGREMSCMSGFPKKAIKIEDVKMNIIKVGDKIKIVKSSRPTYWYSDKIGKVFVVLRDDGAEEGFEVSQVEDGRHFPGWVDYDDCILVKEKEEMNRLQVGSYIMKEDIIKLGEEKWNKFRSTVKKQGFCVNSICGLYDYGVYETDWDCVILSDYGLGWNFSQFGKYPLTVQDIEELIKEKEEMKEFNLKTMPWWIKVENEEQSKAVQEWLFEQGMSWDSGDKELCPAAFKYLTNYCDEVDDSGFMYFNYLLEQYTPDKEIKLSFSLKVQNVEFPLIKTEQEIQLEKLKEQIEELNKQASMLEKMIKGGA